MKKAIIVFLLLNLLTAYAFAQNLVFEENFDDDRNGWLNDPYPSSNIKAKISDGLLEITNKNSDTAWAYTIHQNLDTTKNFEIQLRFMLKDGPGKVYCFGSFYWGGIEGVANSWVLFSRKRVKAKNCLGGDHKQDLVVNRNNHPILKKGVFYKLTVRKSGRVYRIFLNDSFQLELPFQPFKGDNLSLAVGKNCTVAFDNLKIYDTN